MNCEDASDKVCMVKKVELIESDCASIIHQCLALFTSVLTKRIRPVACTYNHIRQCIAEMISHNKPCSRDSM